MLLTALIIALEALSDYESPRPLTAAELEKRQAVALRAAPPRPAYGLAAGPA